MTIGGLADPVGLAFDASGNLFVANRANDTVVMFTPDLRLTSGNPTPAVTISSNTGSLGIPGPIAFDASGSLWVTNGAGTIVRFGASQLTSSGSPVPEVTIDDGAGGNLVNPSGLAFDAAGDLWVADFAGTPIVKFVDPGSLAGAVNPTPAVTLTGVANSSGVLFDNSGSLWVLSFASNVLFRFNSPGLLSGAVSPAADAMIDGAASINDGLIALYASPVGLPIITP
jgi:streptogramin lyase